jgi:2'-5' RNA ligase
VRLFVAVDLPAPVRDASIAQVASLQEMWPVLSWVAPERWHLTLTFLGDVEDTATESLVARLERACGRTQPFDLALGGLGRFDHRVLYLKIHGQVAELRRLAQRTAAAARRTGLDVPRERFRPHVTVARARQRIDLRPVVAALPKAEQSPTWRVREIVLVQSRLGPSPQHELVAHIPLADGRLGSAP